LELRQRDPDVLINLAVVLHKKGKPQEALPLAQQAADAAPKRAYVLTELGEIQLDLGQYSDSYRAFERALDRDRRWPPTRLGLAGLYYNRGYFLEAIRFSLDFMARTDRDPERWVDERIRAQALIDQAQER